LIEHHIDLLAYAEQLHATIRMAFPNAPAWGGTMIVVIG